MFGKNKKKLDSKVRFQNRGFKSRLHEQRNYKREKKNVPQTNWGVFLSKVGLGNWVSQVLTVLILMFLVYWVFIPNLFFIKHVNITSSNSTVDESSKNLTNLFLKKYLPWPQGNIIFLSKEKLKNYLLEKDSKILSVDKITKDFPSTLIIQTTARVDEFVIQNKFFSYFSISQDGQVTGDVAPNASGTLPSNLVLIKLNQDSGLPLGSKPFKDDWFKFLRGVNLGLPDVAKTSPANFDLSDFSNPYFTLTTQAGYEIKFDASSDLEKTLARLKLLLSQLQPGDIKLLYYIDMRFIDRAYVCYKNAECTQDTPPVVNSTSTTNTIIK